ncbi:MAG: sialate O-acetylesterase, partial [Muribaculaceae bacterium]|nr:sialate O-acetylesterase [Muribaculaceae bacterium]
GEREVARNNVLVRAGGYCSGQANMEQPMKGYLCQPVDGALETVLMASPSRPIRTFTVPHALKAEPQTDTDSRWRVNEPDAVAYASAVAYYFADCINESLDVPVGIIMSSWGGTQVQGWMSPESLASCGIDTSHLGADKPDPTSPYAPGAMFNGMVAPLTPYTVKGMLWYQGEANVYDPDLYERLMQAFVPDMRHCFGNADMPFYYVQIAPHESVYADSPRLKGKAGDLRLVQARLMEQVPNVGMVVTVDLGERTNIHHRDKRTVGRRLAYWALVRDYGFYNDAKVSCTGPVYREMKVEDGVAYLYFDNCFGGVAPYGYEIDGFELAGDDGVWHDAVAKADPSRSDGRVVRLSCSDVPHPVKARYAYGDYHPGTLTDIWGLPASPFVAEKGEPAQP